MNAQAVILADAPHTLFTGADIESFPIGLLKIAGETILAHQIKAYLAAGLCQQGITVLLGHEGKAVQEYLQAHFPNLNLVHNPCYESPNRTLALSIALQNWQKASSKNPEVLFLSMHNCVFSKAYFEHFIKDSSKNTSAQSHLQNAKPYLYKFSASSKEAIIKLLAEQSQNPQTPTCIFENIASPLLLNKFSCNKNEILCIDSEESLLMADKIFSSFNFTSKKAFFFDFDGTLFLGNTPIPGAIDFLKKYKSHFDFYFLTNNTSRTPEEYLGKLASVGIQIDENQVVTPLHALFDYIKCKKYDSIYLIANQRVKTFVQKHLPNVTLDFDMDKNQAAVLAYDTELTYEKLKNLSIMLNNKAVEYIATHADLFCPHEKGPLPDVGGMIALIKSTNGHEPHTILGKPSVHLIQRYIDKYGTHNIVVVGDRLYTDKQLADNANCDFICVLSGETLRKDLVHNKTPYPSIVVKDLGEIDKPLL